MEEDRTKRSWRRHHRARKLAQAIFVAQRWNSEYGGTQKTDEWHERVRQSALLCYDHLKVAQGCFCCCNPRRVAKGKNSYQLTLDEHRAAFDASEQIKEYFASDEEGDHG